LITGFNNINGSNAGQKSKIAFKVKNYYFKGVHSEKKFVFSQDVTFCLGFEIFWKRTLADGRYDESTLHCGMNLNLGARGVKLAWKGYFMLTRSVAHRLCILPNV
jgi:hypothetical protein